MKKTFKIIFGITLFVLIIIYSYKNIAYNDVERLKKIAPSFLKERGFKIISYDGYEGSLTHGGFVWYQVIDKSNYRYELALGEWDGEVMIYNTNCLNAVQNSK